MAKQAIIIGAGCSGATLARALAEKGYHIDIYDKRKTLAGNLYDYDDNGVIVQSYGPHVFHTKKKEIFEFLSQFATFYKYEHRVRGRICGKYVPIPFNLTSLKNFFSAEEIDLAVKIMTPKLNDKKSIGVKALLDSKEPIIKKIGQFIYDNVYYNYTFKQWGKDPKDLDPSVLERVPVYFSDEDRYSLDEYQYMPRGGFTAMFEKMLDHDNITIHLDTNPIDRISFFGNDIIFNQVKNPLIFYTGSLDEFFNYQYGRLPYRTLDFVFHSRKSTSIQKYATINYPAAKDFTRITEFSKFTTEAKVKNYSVCLKEFPHFSEENDTPYYPIENKESAEIYGRYFKEAQNYTSLYVLGRLGSYKYYNIDQAIEQALLLAKKF